MKWSRDKSKKSEDSQNGNDMSRALVKQDPRTKVKTTSAQSESTNTTTQNATIFNSNAKTVTYQSTKQTVTSRQTARITEITTRRTPTPQELEEMIRLLHMNKKPETKTFTTTSTTSSVPLRRNRPSNLPALPPSSSRNSINSLNNKSTPKFKSTASPVSRLIFNYESPSSSGSASNGAGDGSSKTPITPTLVKTQTTTFSEKNGRTVTQRVEEHRIKFDPSTFKLSTPNSPLTRTFMGEDNFKFSSTDARPAIMPALPAPKPSTATFTFNTKPTTTSSTYTSPYSHRQVTRGLTNTSNVTFTTTSKPSTTSNLSFTTSTKPISSIRNTTTPLKTTSTTSSSTNKPGSLFSSWATTPAKPFTTTSSSTSSSANKPGSLFSSWKTSPPKPPTTTITTSTLDAKPFSRTSPAGSTYSTYATSNPSTTPATTSILNSGNATSNVPRAKPGYAYIFNNVIFDNPNNEERIGSAEDVKALVQTFESFKMKVTVIENAKVDKIKKTVEKIQTKDFSDNACLVIVILSHGTRHEEIAAKDGHYSIDDHVLFPILRNGTLNDKPKLFFIQACKGSMESQGYYTDAIPFSPPGNANEILKCYSTFEGFVSYRTEKGSIFIQALCQNLKLFGNAKNIKDIMEKVTQIVKQQSQNKQIPAYTSTLTKPFVFGDYVKWAK